MPTPLQSFKLLATRCSTSAAATQSPTASPNLRRRRSRSRKTLRMLLRHDPPEPTRYKLKDLLLSSPPPINKRHDHDGLLPSAAAAAAPGFRFRTGSRFRRSGAAPGAASSAFRHRLLRRAWRPVLLSIPE
ncbi:hypothetical protein Fmac_016465 [Flemingia macrophylla]|uniref:Uncharacterized protein n=1 Tax=Flemingia macrophylla TaxID=520843 RepID=A0ABD1MI68_9FABA